jgi:flagellar hook-associated protein 2
LRTVSREEAFTMPLTINGLVTGIDTDTILTGLLEIQQQRIDLLNVQKQKVVAQQTAFSGIEASLLSLRSSLGRLARSQDNVLQSRIATVSDEAALTAAASSKATPGVYQIRVNSLAQSHQVAAQGLADPDARITHGTLTLQVGSLPPTEITIDDTNDTLQALADAINAADADVSASVINDGTGGGAPYRLLLTSSRTGAEHTISITNGLADSSASATKPVFDLDNPVQSAADAVIALGSGAGAITVQSATNQVSSFLEGVTLNLTAADPDKPITLTVAADTEAAKTAIQEFVDAFNDFSQQVDEQVRYDAATGTAGLLQGNRAAIDLQDQVRRTLLDVVPGLGASANRLTAIGLSVTNQGTLSLDTARLDEVLSGADPDISADDVLRLFALAGESTNPNIQFVLGSSRTQAGGAPYQVDITQAAERASLLAANSLAASTVIDGTNNTVSLTIDGAASSTLTLTAGTYTPTELAAHLEEVINADDQLSGRTVAITVAGDQLQITSNSYGSSSEVTIGAGAALAVLGLTGTESDTGVDVAGSFIVDGVTEPAAGRGRILTGDVDNEHTADLAVRVTLTAAQLQAGPEAELTVTRGLASRLDQLLGSLLDPVSGRLKFVKDEFETRATDLQKSIDRQSALFESQRQRLLEQFQALETAVQQLQSTSAFIGSQLASLGALRATGASA